MEGLGNGPLYGFLGFGVEAFLVYGLGLRVFWV